MDTYYTASSVSSTFAKNTAVYCDKKLSPSTNHGVVTTTPPSVRRVCRSPFVTPNHPLNLFGEMEAATDDAPSKTLTLFPPQSEAQAAKVVASSASSSTVILHNKSKPLSRPQKMRQNCIGNNSMYQMPLFSSSSSSPPEGPPSPFRRLMFSCAFDDTDMTKEEHQETPSPEKAVVQQQQHHRVLCKSATFGMERMREMSIDSPPQRQLFDFTDGEDLEGDEDCRRLHRMKRRLFLESVATQQQPSQDKKTKPTSQHQQQVKSRMFFFPTEQERQQREVTPRHSNRSSWPFSSVGEQREGEEPMNSTNNSMHDSMATTMEGMEVVLEDLSDGGVVPSSNHNNSEYFLSFSSSFSSSSLQMEIHEEEEQQDEQQRPATSVVALVSGKVGARSAFLHKGFTGDSSVATEPTTASSIDSGFDEHHWASISSIAEQPITEE